MAHMFVEITNDKNSHMTFSGKYNRMFFAHISANLFPDYLRLFRTVKPAIRPQLKSGLSDLA